MPLTGIDNQNMDKRAVKQRHERQRDIETHKHSDSQAKRTTDEQKQQITDTKSQGARAQT